MEVFLASRKMASRFLPEVEVFEENEDDGRLKIGSFVEVRDDEDDQWSLGVITEMKDWMIKVRAHGMKTAFEFDQIRAPTSEVSPETAARMLAEGRADSNDDDGDGGGDDDGDDGDISEDSEGDAAAAVAPMPPPSQGQQDQRQQQEQRQQQRLGGRKSASPRGAATGNSSSNNGGGGDDNDDNNDTAAAAGAANKEGGGAALGSFEPPAQLRLTISNNHVRLFGEQHADDDYLKFFCEPPEASLLHLVPGRTFQGAHVWRGHAPTRYIEASPRFIWLYRDVRNGGLGVAHVDSGLLASFGSLTPIVGAF